MVRPGHARPRRPALDPGHVALPVPRRLQRVDRIHRVPGRDQRLHPRTPVSLNPHRDAARHPHQRQVSRSSRHLSRLAEQLAIIACNRAMQVPPVGRPDDRGVGEVLVLSPVGDQGPGRGGRVHRVPPRPTGSRSLRQPPAAGVHQLNIVTDPVSAVISRENWVPLARDLRPIYTAPDEAAAAAALEDFAAAWGGRYPAIVKVWRSHWAARSLPFCSAVPASSRRRTIGDLSMNRCESHATPRRADHPSSDQLSWPGGTARTTGATNVGIRS